MIVDLTTSIAATANANLYGCTFDLDYFDAKSIAVLGSESTCGIILGFNLTIDPSYTVVLPSSIPPGIVELPDLDYQTCFGAVWTDSLVVDSAFCSPVVYVPYFGDGYIQLTGNVTSSSSVTADFRLVGTTTETLSLPLTSGVSTPFSLTVDATSSATFIIIHPLDLVFRDLMVNGSPISTVTYGSLNPTRIVRMTSGGSVS